MKDVDILDLAKHLKSVIEENPEAAKELESHFNNLSKAQTKKAEATEELKNTVVPSNPYTGKNFRTPREVQLVKEAVEQVTLQKKELKDAVNSVPKHLQDDVLGVFTKKEQPEDKKKVETEQSAPEEVKKQDNDKESVSPTSDNSLQDKTQKSEDIFFDRLFQKYEPVFTPELTPLVKARQEKYRALRKDDKAHRPGSPEDSAHDVVEEKSKLPKELQDSPDDEKTLQHLRNSKGKRKEWERSEKNKKAGLDKMSIPANKEIAPMDKRDDEDHIRRQQRRERSKYMKPSSGSPTTDVRHAKLMQQANRLTEMRRNNRKYQQRRRAQQGPAKPGQGNQGQ